MTGTELTPGAQRRLASLRDLFGRDSFPDDRSAFGDDRSGSIGVDVDASGWVLHTDVRRLDDDLRDASALRLALNQACRSAELSRLTARAEDESPTPEELDSGRDLLEGRRRVRVPQATTLPPITRPEGPVDVPNLAGFPEPDRIVRGTSRDGEVTVTAVGTNGLADLTVDAAWLRTTSADYLRYALNEAFEDAYLQGERR